MGGLRGGVGEGAGICLEADGWDLGSPFPREQWETGCLKAAESDRGLCGCWLGLGLWERVSWAPGGGVRALERSQEALLLSFLPTTHHQRGVPEAWAALGPQPWALLHLGYPVPYCHVLGRCGPAMK